MLGAVGPDLAQSCQDAGFWYRVFHPECVGTGSDTQITASIVNTPPSAPLTVGAMTVNGVWEPDYAAQRTWGEVMTNNDMAVAALEQASGPFGNPSGPDPNACDSSLYSLTHMPSCYGFSPMWLYLGAGVLAYAVLRK